jgi:hypothetical protein
MLGASRSEATMRPNPTNAFGLFGTALSEKIRVFQSGSLFGSYNTQRNQVGPLAVNVSLKATVRPNPGPRWCRTSRPSTSSPSPPRSGPPGGGYAPSIRVSLCE